MRNRFWLKFSRPSKVGWWSLGIWFYHDYYVRFSFEIALFLLEVEGGWRKKSA